VASLRLSREQNEVPEFNPGWLWEGRTGVRAAGVPARRRMVGRCRPCFLEGCGVVDCCRMMGAWTGFAGSVGGLRGARVPAPL